MSEHDGGSPPGPVISDRVLTVPNLLSFFRLLLVPVFAVLILTERDGWAVAVLMLSGATDWLDGTIARRYGLTTRLGQLLDPAADRLYILVTLLGLAWREVVPWWLVLVLVLRDLVLTGCLPLLAAHGHGPLEVSFLGKAATFNLLCAFPLVLLGHGSGDVAEVIRPIGWAFTWWGTALYWWSALTYLRQVRDVIRGTRADRPGRAAEGAA